MLGVQAHLGNTPLAGEDQPQKQFTVLLSNSLWRSHFASDPHVIGRTLNLSGVTYSVIGVAPANFNFPNKDVELWTSLPLEPPTRRGPYFLTGIARLKPGVTMLQARAEMSALKSSFSGESLNLNVLPVNEFVVGNVRLALLVLFVAVTLVLLIAAVNVANLMLVRSTARVKETSMRIALGASRTRIIRQLLTESLLLSLASGGLGILLASGGVRLLVKLAPNTIPRLDQIGVDATVLGWTVIVSLLTGLLFGLAPAWQSSRPMLNDSLKESGCATTESTGKRSWRNLLVVSELALAVMLSIGAGLLVKSFRRLQRVDSGVNTERVLTMHLALQGKRYADAQQVNALYAHLLERIQALPGVHAAAVSNSLPPDSTEFSDDFTIEGRPIVPNQAPPIAYMANVSPDYFRTFGIPLRRGRYFEATDSANAPLVAVIDETTARQFFSQEDPIGKRINTANEGQPIWWRVIGVVGDVKYTGLANQTQPTLYRPLIQATSRNTFLSVKTDTADPLGVAAAVRMELKSLDPELPVTGIGTLEHRFATAVAQPRFRTMLIALFAVLALVLAVVGIYGVISYSVTQRTHEMGIRLALGAQAGGVLKLVLKQGAVLAITGVLAGLGVSFVLTRLLRNLLFNVSATDWQTFGGIAALLVSVALLACYLPARRAAKVEPLVALRYE